MGQGLTFPDEKRNPLDFALGKREKEETEPAWESPWGLGRPGWYLNVPLWLSIYLETR